MKLLINKIKKNWATKHLTSKDEALIIEAAQYLNTQGIELTLLDEIYNYIVQNKL